MKSKERSDMDSGCGLQHLSWGGLHAVEAIPRAELALLDMRLKINDLRFQIDRPITAFIIFLNNFDS